MHDKGLRFEDIPEPTTGFIDFEKIYEWFLQDRAGLEADKNVKKNRKKDRRHDSKHASEAPAKNEVKFASFNLFARIPELVA